MNLERVTACGSLSKLTAASEMKDKSKRTQNSQVALHSWRFSSCLQLNASLSTRFSAYHSHPFQLRSGPGGSAFSVHNAHDIITSHKWFWVTQLLSCLCCFRSGGKPCSGRHPASPDRERDSSKPRDLECKNCPDTFSLSIQYDNDIIALIISR